MAECKFAECKFFRCYCNLQLEPVLKDLYRNIRKISIVVLEIRDCHQHNNSLRLTTLYNILNFWKVSANNCVSSICTIDFFYLVFGEMITVLLSSPPVICNTISNND